MPHLDHETDSNLSDNRHFEQVLSQALSSPGRRRMLRGGVGLAGLTLLSGCATLATSSSSSAARALGFASLDKSLLDDVLLPPGYRYTVLHATGDSLDPKVPAYSNLGMETDDWSRRIGDHHDGLDIFFIDAQGRYSPSDTGRAVLVVNHESSADAHFMHPQGQTSNGVSGKKFSQFGDWDLGERPELEVMKEINHHGVSVVEIVRGPQGWAMKLDSALNRRINPHTSMRLAAAREQLPHLRAQMVTRWDPTGATARGTLNNCGHGKTPWGTYLACEENWAFYFQMSSGGAQLSLKELAARRRYGLASAPPTAKQTRAISQGWHTVSATDERFARWNIAAVGASAERDFRNEANTFGYNVEIDPLQPASTPVKRLSMGRLAHESACCSLPKPGQALAFYMGCDARNEYIYKFVSAAVWDDKDIGGGIAAGDKYLNEGKLYVARFDADGRGQWLELSVKDPRIANYSAFKFDNQSEVYLHTRHAADALGATKMDRPEWTAVNPKNGEVYVTLTNNNATHRSPERVDAANPRAYTDIDGKKGSGNPNGHIIRFREGAGGAAATGFDWDIFLFAAEEDAGDANVSGLSAHNSFSSPDGLWFSPTTGICWIQTDDNAMTDETHCMMLAALPGQVGDGAKVKLNNRMVVNGEEQSGVQETFVGATLGEARLRRFLIGPKGSEITGVTEAPGGRALFVNIQHPGEDSKNLKDLQSQWPGNKGYGRAGRPRSATIVITRNDGGVIGV